MAMANGSLQDHKLLIIDLHKQRFSEEEIVDELCAAGVETTFPEVLHYLEALHVIPCPSPVHSKDGDVLTEPSRQDRRATLRVTCHHGETSHVSRTSLTNVPSDPSSIETYKQDIQKHEEFASGYKATNSATQLEPFTEAATLELDADGDNNEYQQGDILTWFKGQGKTWRDQGQNQGSRARLARPKRFRHRNRVEKRQR